MVRKLLVHLFLSNLLMSLSILSHLPPLPLSRGDWYCERASSTYDGTKCSEGHYKIPKADFDQQWDKVRQPNLDSCPRDNATITALLHLGQELRYLPATVIGPYLYDSTCTDNKRGVAILEIAINDVQIPESPFQLEVVDRDCDVDYPGQRKTAGSPNNVLYSNLSHRSYLSLVHLSRWKTVNASAQMSISN
jgi:hypothetical protein